MNPIDIDAILLQITALRGPKLLIAFLIFLGYFIKAVPSRWVPNTAIPKISAVAAMILTPVLVAWPTPTTMEPDVRFIDIAAWVQIEIQGLLFWALAWFGHATLLKPMIDSKLAGLMAEEEKPEPVAPAPVVEAAVVIPVTTPPVAPP